MIRNQRESKINYKFFSFQNMLANSQQEEVKLAAMQRAWQPNRRLASTLSLFEEEPVVLEEFISIPRQVSEAKFRGITASVLIHSLSIR